MATTTARSGFQWLVEGIRLFRLQPLGFVGLFMTYLLLSFILGFIPILGQIAGLMLIPVIAVVFMQACYLADNGKIVSQDLFTKP